MDNRRTERDALMDAFPAIKAVLGGKRVRRVMGELKGPYESKFNVAWGCPDFQWEIEGDTVRPFTPEEAAKHLGRELLRIGDRIRVKTTFRPKQHELASVSERCVKINSMTCGTMYVEYDNLAKDWTFEDGSPCGIVE